MKYFHTSIKSHLEAPQLLVVHIFRLIRLPARLSSTETSSPQFVLVGPFIGGAYKCSPNLKAYRQGEGGSILILELHRLFVSRPVWLVNIYLIFLLKFLYFYFPTFCQPCSHKHLAYPSRPYALSMKLTEVTQHIMMKS